MKQGHACLSRQKIVEIVPIVWFLDSTSGFRRNGVRGVYICTLCDTCVRVLSVCVWYMCLGMWCVFELTLIYLCACTAYMSLIVYVSCPCVCVSVARV